MPLLVVGTSHQTAPLEAREKLAFSRDQYCEKVHELCAIPAVDEALLVSTCNRTEIYGIVLPENEDAISQWLTNEAGWNDEEAGNYIYSRKDAHAVEHLFNVVSGLDSLVLGEPQIVGQLKDSWQEATAAGGAGKIIDRLFQHAFATGKTVRNETGINEHPLSVAYIAMVLARQIFGDLTSKTVLMVGAGEMIELCGRHFHRQGVEELIIANRSVDKAEALAEEFGARAVALESLKDVLPEADIVISSTAARTPVIKVADIRQALKTRRHQPMFLVDIAVPRDIDPDVARLDDAYLYTIDDLQQVADENTKQRSRAAKEATSLIQTSVEDFMRWLHGARAAKFLKRLRSHAEQSGNELVDKALKQIKAGKDPEKVVRQLASSLTNKILHVPSIRLRQAAESKEYGILKAADWIFEVKEDRNMPDQDDSEKDKGKDR